MNRRRLILIASFVGILLVVIIGGGVWWIQRSLPVEVTVNESPESLPILPSNKPDLAPRAPVIPVINKGESGALRLARFFTERFGSFSSQESFFGIRSLMPLMTPSFQTWVESQYLPGLVKSYSSDNYSGQSTKVLSASIVDSSERVTTVQLRTQQTIIDNQGQSRVLNTTFTVRLVGDNKAWLVDAVFTDPTP